MCLDLMHVCNSRETAVKAMKRMQGQTLDGHALQLKFSNPKKPAGAQVRFVSG